MNPKDAINAFKMSLFDEDSENDSVEEITGPPLSNRQPLTSIQTSFNVSKPPRAKRPKDEDSRSRVFEKFRKSQESTRKGSFFIPPSNKRKRKGGELSSVVDGIFEQVKSSNMGDYVPRRKKQKISSVVSGSNILFNQTLKKGRRNESQFRKPTISRNPSSIQPRGPSIRKPLKNVFSEIPNEANLRKPKFSETSSQINKENVNHPKLHTENKPLPTIFQGIKPTDPSHFFKKKKKFKPGNIEKICHPDEYDKRLVSGLLQVTNIGKRNKKFSSSLQRFKKEKIIESKEPVDIVRQQQTTRIRNLSSNLVQQSFQLLRNLEEISDWMQDTDRKREYMLEESKGKFEVFLRKREEEAGEGEEEELDNSEDDTENGASLFGRKMGPTFF